MSEFGNIATTSTCTSELLRMIITEMCIMLLRKKRLNPVCKERFTFALFQYFVCCMGPMPWQPQQWKCEKLTPNLWHRWINFSKLSLAVMVIVCGRHCRTPLHISVGDGGRGNVPPQNSALPSVDQTYTNPSSSSSHQYCSFQIEAPEPNSLITLSTNLYKLVFLFNTGRSGPSL